MIKAVFLDAIKTLFSPQPDEITMYHNVILKITGKDIPADKLEHYVTQALIKTEALDCAKNNHKKQWDFYPNLLTHMIGCPEDQCNDVAKKLLYETWGNYDNYELYEDVKDAIKIMHDHGLYIACISNEDGWLESFFKHFGIREDFDYIISSEEAGAEKPNPAIFEKALSDTGFKPHEVIFIGDSLLSDYFGSKAVGMKSILIDRNDKIKDDSIIKIKSLTNIKEYL